MAYNIPQHPMKRSQNSQNGKKKHKKDQQLDPEFGQYRALPVSKKIYDSITSDTIPTDADTYLALVRKQAEEGSSVMFIPREISYDNATNDATNEAVSLSNGTPNQRTEEQNDGQITKEHQITKQQKDHYLEIIKEFKHQRELLPNEGELSVPADFIFPNNFTEWRSYTMSHEPTLSLISNLDHDLIFKLIIYVTKWLVHNTPLILTKWMYSILVRVPEVLNASEMSGIRDLAKKATKVKNKECNDVSHFICDVILVISGEVFGQKDLFSL